MAHQHALHRRSLAPVIAVSGEDDIFVGLPLAKRERTGAGRVQCQPSGAEIAVLLVFERGLAVDDRAGTVLRQHHQHEVRVIRLGQVEDEGLFVFGDEKLVGGIRFKAAGLEQRCLGKVAGEQAFQAPDHVIGGDRIAGGEGRLAQVEADRHPVLGNLPAFRDARLDRAILVAQDDQRIVDIVEHLNGLAAGNGGRIERQDVVHRGRHDKLVFRRFRQSVERHGAEQERSDGCSCKKVSHVSSV
ncbi:hypothetical protein D3C73_821630 [compost metagenome]